ncbi:MAG: hypothetical protein DIJKHBIC_00018 [Thermoanaerobaculia bacterium]|nr:hypothetical protein [Thermoanaerobaculia bacterium]
MNCPGLSDPELPELYLRGELDEATAAAYEDHYFNCEGCLENLKQLGELTTGLERGRTEIETERPRAARGARWALPLAACTVLLGCAVAFGLFRASRGGLSQPVAEMARFEAPPYSPIRLRGHEREGLQRFRDAMDAYARQDWEGALPGLIVASKLEPESAQVLFYLGATHLLAGDVDKAISTLSRAVALGEGPYLEESRFYLGKAYLRAGNVPAAREEFARVVQLQGPRQQEAKTLLARLAGITGARP